MNAIIKFHLKSNPKTCGAFRGGELLTAETCGSAPHFVDMASSSFAYRPVGCLFDLGITTGTSPATFSPKRGVTREEMAAFLERLYLVLTS